MTKSVANRPAQPTQSVVPEVKHAPPVASIAQLHGQFSFVNQGISTAARQVRSGVDKLIAAMEDAVEEKRVADLQAPATPVHRK